MAWQNTFSVAFTCLLSACAAPVAAPERASADVGTNASTDASTDAGTDAGTEAGARLRSLLDASDEALLDRNPIFALYRGDTRRAAQHGDYLSPAYVQAEHQAAQRDLAQLAQIPRAQLSANDRVAYDTFRWSREDERERNAPPAALFWPLLKLDQMNGWHLFFPELSSGDGVAPYRSVVDYDNGLARITGFIGWLDRAVQRMREGQRLWGMETLYLHEATPGHHMQGSLAAENLALPKLLLLVDTGLHAYGWTREQAIAYMLAHSAMSPNDATTEIERYIADPGQALAYKVGALSIQRLRQRAEQALGPRFDIRAFHHQVLGTGGVPMAVLEEKIEAWIAAR